MKFYPIIEVDLFDWGSGEHRKKDVYFIVGQL